MVGSVIGVIATVASTNVSVHSSASAGIYEQPAPFGGASAPDTSLHCELVTQPSTQLTPQAIPSTRSLGCRDAGPEHASVAGCPPTILNE